MSSFIFPLDVSGFTFHLYKVLCNPEQLCQVANLRDGVILAIKVYAVFLCTVIWRIALPNEPFSPEQVCLLESSPS